MSVNQPTTLSAPRFVKVSATGALLPQDADEWDGVYVPAASLIVARRPMQRALPFKSANAACREVVLCAAKAKRSISLREFVNHLLEDGRSAPALDPEFFTIDDPYQWIWTSDECAPAGYAWYVNLVNGYSSRSHRDFYGRALAVRAGQFSGFGDGR